ncbi:LysR family transcriptional regulator [Actinomadura craniellae]|uniref:LysR family transcriptional regulator n=1 Tax=Actinomadura craniellae TaxID=2231787 RepID=A0A365H3P0_9ACTN|nr:LysR family transcriptional regulator [Actinomadura craniellae]RAY13720.1 LysR family transcriptional regulator [Actinomadura craniellae]
MTLNQLRAFLLAVRTGSFTAAAAELKMAQASVSELVRRMEDESGMLLFVRGGRRLVLTPAGAELLPYAERAVSSVDEGRQVLKSIGSLDGGAVTFGLLRNASYYLMPDLAQQFHEAHPNVRLKLVGQSSGEVAAAVSAGELEAGLVVLPVDDTGLKVTPLIRDEVLYASADPGRLAVPMDLRRMVAADLVMYDARYGWAAPTRRQLAERAQLEGLKIEPIIEVEHVESALKLVARGVGDTVIPRAVADSPSCPPEVRTVPFAEPLYDTIAFVQRASSALSPGARELARRARSTLLARITDPAQRVHPVPG